MGGISSVSTGVLNLNTSGLLAGVTFSDSNDRLTVSSAANGTYLITYTVYYAGSGPGTFAVRRSGSDLSPTLRVPNLTFNNMGSTGQLIATLSANEYVQVALTDGSSGDSIPNLSPSASITLSIVRLGP